MQAPSWSLHQVPSGTPHPALGSACRPHTHQVPASAPTRITLTILMCSQMCRNNTTKCYVDLGRRRNTGARNKCLSLGKGRNCHVHACQSAAESTRTEMPMCPNPLGSVLPLCAAQSPSSVPQLCVSSKHASLHNFCQ